MTVRFRSLAFAALVLLALGPPILLALMGMSNWPAGADVGFPLDDTWIHLQFGRTLAAGAGLEYNDGEAVLGTTSPIWSALLALAHTLPGSPARWALAAGILAHALLVWAIYFGGRTLRLARPAAVLGAAWVASSGWLVWSAVSGMEISLFALVSLIALVRLDLEARRPASLPLALPLLCLLVLLRPEALLLVALACGELAWRRCWARSVVGLALGGLAIGPWVIWTWLRFGSPLPSTYAVKASGAQGLHLPELEYLRSVFWVLFQFQPMVPLLIGGGVVWLALRSQRLRSSWVAAAWLLALPLALGAQSRLGGSHLVGNFGRYFFPLLPIAALLAAAALAPLLAGWSRRATVAFVCAATLPGLALLPKAAGIYVTNVQNVRDGDLAAAVWLEQHLPPEAVIAVNDIGLMKYLLPEHRVLDVVGIAHPQVREFGARAAAAGLPWWRGVIAYLAEQRPDYVVVFSSWLPQVGYVDGFTPVHRIDIPNNITMGGDDIVVWSTPWTRQPLVDAPMERIELDWLRPEFHPDQFEDHVQ
jgi:hypothetical protein